MTLPLMKRVLLALWGTQWTSVHASENNICAYGCSQDSYKDQTSHFANCSFVQLWNDLKTERMLTKVVEDFKEVGK